MEQKKRRFSLATKTNVFVTAIILIVSAGLVTIGYTVHAGQIDGIYIDMVNKTARAVRDAINTEAAVHIRDIVLSDEYQALRKEAEEKNDPSVLMSWMQSMPSYFAEADMISLYDEYMSLCGELSGFRDTFGLSAVYVQYDLNGVTYNVADPDENLFYPGTTEAPTKEFANDKDNAPIPAKVYRNSFGWLCTACEPFSGLWSETGEPEGYVGVDLDMNQVIRKRHVYLLNSIIFIFLLTGAALFVTLTLLNRGVVKPLKQLIEGTREFAGIERDYTPDDVMKDQVPSRDEIGELYRDIRDLQSHMVEYTGRLAKVSAEKERILTELRLAATIQDSMLPTVFPPFPDRDEFELYAVMDPAREVGGDFYDFFMVDQDHLALVIADVSGKGISGALFMMSSKLLISTQTMSGAGPAEILSAVNGKICETNEKTRMFVTVWLGILDTRTGVMTCCNAGHEYPFVRRADGKFEVLRDVHGLVAGGFPDMPYKEYQLRLEAGDVVFVYTDGVTEATNGQEELFGMKRLEETLNSLKGKNCREILEGVKESVERFVDGAEQFDDLTMLCMQYRPPRKNGNEKENS